MIDAETHQRIEVHTEGTAGAYLMVTSAQLDAVIAVLRQHNISHWIDADAISLDGEPAVAVINFGRNSDVQAVQNLLDAQ